jgi:hypothetical protein
MLRPQNVAGFVEGCQSVAHDREQDAGGNGNNSTGIAMTAANRPGKQLIFINETFYSCPMNIRPLSN